MENQKNIRCNVCGGNDIEFLPHSRIGRCNSCGALLTLPDFEDHEILSLLNQAYLQRTTYKFDEAIATYNYIIEKNPNEISAYEVVNDYSEDKLSRIFSDYGEERYSKSIARKICEKRKIKPIETTFELVDIIKSAVPSKALNEKQHPAKRVFQAIRIEVNEELVKLKQAVIDSIMSLNDGGRLAIITFHSLEDKIVKHAYEEMEGRCTCPKDFPVCVCGYKSYGVIVNKKPITSTDEELEENPRARSAKLRVFERRISR